MDLSNTPICPPDPSGGFSVILAERVLAYADALALPQQWHGLNLGHTTHRRTAYAPEHRLAALIAGLACGLRGIAPGNRLLRPNAALAARTGGRFPDQGTVHRWLDDTTPEQAAALRRHLHQAVTAHGRFWELLRAGPPLAIDLDGQGLVARGHRFEQAANGYLGDGLDRGYQRYVCYVGATAEVLDELLLPGNRTAMSALPEMLEGLNEVIPRAWRHRVLLRGDSHFGTAANVWAMKHAGYHYLCPLFNHWGKKRLQALVAGRRGAWFTARDSNGHERRVQYWLVRRWRLAGRGGHRVTRPRAVVYRELREGKEEWLVLLTDTKGRRGRQLWEHYHERGGTIEEYNDQAERAYHLEVMRTGCYAGLQAVHSLVALCWNLTRWATEGLRLPEVPGAAGPAGWREARGMDLEQLMVRASQSGLRLWRSGAGAALEVEDTAGTAESAAWLGCLRRPVQLLLRLTG